MVNCHGTGKTATQQVQKRGITHMETHEMDDYI